MADLRDREDRIEAPEAVPGVAEQQCFGAEGRRRHCAYTTWCVQTVEAVAQPPEAAGLQRLSGKWCNGGGWTGCSGPGWTSSGGGSESDPNGSELDPLAFMVNKRIPALPGE